MRRLTVALVMPSSWAAAVKEPLSTMRTRMRAAFKSIVSPVKLYIS